VHIPDGYLGPETLAVGWAITVPVWYVASQRTKKLLTQPKMVPVLAASAAFSFLVMMLNVPVLGGTTAHAVGAVLIAVIAGPWVAVLAVTAALVIQALFFGDGGLLTLGINCLNMAIVMPLLGYVVYRFLSGASDLRSSRRLASAGVAAYCGLVAAAFLNSIELGVQPLLHTVNGVAQYFPYGLRTTIPAMVGSHALIVGPIEAVLTVAIFAYLRQLNPELFRAGDLKRVRARWLVILVAAFIVVVPLGLIASGSAWGEWGAAEIQQRVGYVPHGLGLLGDRWKGLLPDYGWSGANGAWSWVAYVVSAIVGVAVLSVVAWAVVSTRRRRHRSVPPDHPSTPESVGG
jgi:cobalt/nickel transport system permease protein